MITKYLFIKMVNMVVLEGRLTNIYTILNNSFSRIKSKIKLNKPCHGKFNSVTITGSAIRCNPGLQVGNNC